MGGAQNSNRTVQKQRLHLPRFALLAGVTMESIQALTAVIGANVDQQISWLQSKGLLSRNKFCPACNQPMDLQQRNDITDGYRWCQDSSCKRVFHFDLGHSLNSLAGNFTSG